MSSKLALDFYSGTLDFSVKPEELVNLTWSEQQKFLDATIHSKLMKKYPVSIQFTRLFLKKLINYLEAGREVHDKMYSELCRAMKFEIVRSHRHYVIDDDLNNVISVKESSCMVVNGTTGMRTWEAAVIMADWAISNEEIFNNKKVLELGSGVGLTGITIAKLCNVKSLILTDCHHEVLNTMCDNIDINFPHLKPEECHKSVVYKDDKTDLGVMKLDWCKINDVPTKLAPDILLGADIVYDPSILESLCHIIKYFCERNNNLQVFITSVIRNEDTFNEFLKTLDNLNLLHEEIIFNESVHIKWDPNIQKRILKIQIRAT